MPTVEKVALGVVGVAMATTLLLPGRQTAPVLNAIFGGFGGVLSKAMAR
jgi:hypothetical protein